MAADNIVHLIRETRSTLTKETKGDNGVSAFVCDINGAALSRDAMHNAREVFMDGFSGEHFIRISHEEKEAAAKAGQQVMQGVGEVHGWFIEAPDFTLIGRLGEKSKKLAL